MTVCIPGLYPARERKRIRERREGKACGNPRKAMPTVRLRIRQRVTVMPHPQRQRIVIEEHAVAFRHSFRLPTCQTGTQPAYHIGVVFHKQFLILTQCERRKRKLKFAARHQPSHSFAQSAGGNRHLRQCLGNGKHDELVASLCSNPINFSIGRFEAASRNKSDIPVKRRKNNRSGIWQVCNGVHMASG